MDRDSLVYKAKLAEQAERFDEMVQDMYVLLQRNKRRIKMTLRS
jgi:hypothetical protein